MRGSFLKRVLSPIVELRDGEIGTVLLMFGYSFLAMAAYNIIKPAATSKFINGLGALNTLWVYLASGLLMGFVMQGYSRLVSAVPRRWVFPGTQVVVLASLVLFWSLFKSGQVWVPVAFFVWGRVLLGIFLISQFWTLANSIYDPRQAKRVFGFIGGGSLVGGLTGAWLTALLAKRLGTDNLVLLSAGLLAICFVLVLQILRRTALAEPSDAEDEETLGGGAALRLLMGSKHLQLIAMVIGFAALGAVVIELQLNMAAEQQVKGQDGITQFLATVTGLASLIGIVIQIWVTPYLYRLLGIGFALMVLPVSLGATAILILFNPVLWASGIARVFDQMLRYSLDKTTREVLFLPLPTELKLKAKPFVDVVVDRFIGKGVGSILLLILVTLFHFTWFQLSYLSGAFCILWMVMAQRAKREYLAVFRKSLEKRELGHAALTAPSADLATIEALVEELGSFDEQRVLYAIDVLESLEKRNLVSPLLLHHDAPAVRARALGAFQATPRGAAEGVRWRPAVERLLRDESPEVRAAAVAALASLTNGNAAELMRPYLKDRDPRIVATAAVALAASGAESELAAAEAAFQELTRDRRPAAAAARREAARAIEHVREPRFRHLLLPLLYDADLDVAREAIAGTRNLGEEGFFFVPALVSLLRHRQLKTAARDVLVSYGEGVVDVLGYFMRDPEEDVWVRRHVPGTLARIPCQKSVDLLVATLPDEDGFLRFKVIAALERIVREHKGLVVPKEPVEKLAQNEARHYFRYLGLNYNLFGKDGISKDSLLSHALEEKQKRVVDRLYRLLGLIHPWRDVAAARHAIERGDARLRASAVEYMDNVLTGGVRKCVMPILEDMPLAERVKKGNALLKTRNRDVPETLARLIYDDDPVVAAAAIDAVRETETWSLADDLEQVLQFRDAKDWYVFEAASWALAAYRLPEDKRRVV